MEYLQSHKSEIENKTVLELSSGCGGVSMACSGLGSKGAIATELPDILEINTKINIKLNNSKLHFMNLVSENLEWDNEEHLNGLFQKYIEINYLIVCECGYGQAPFDKGGNTLIKGTDTYKKGEILFAYKKRYIYQEKCIKEIIKKYFIIVDIERSELHKDFKDKDNYVIFHLKRINI